MEEAFFDPASNWSGDLHLLLLRHQRSHLPLRGCELGSDRRAVAHTYQPVREKRRDYLSEWRQIVHPLSTVDRAYITLTDNVQLIIVILRKRLEPVCEDWAQHHPVPGQEQQEKRSAWITAPAQHPSDNDESCESGATACSTVGGALSLLTGVIVLGPGEIAAFVGAIPPVAAA